MTSSLNESKEALESFLSGKLAQVDVKKIQDELNKLWQQASNNSVNEEHPQIMRACSCNLILVTDKNDAETTEANILDEIVLAHPSRAILAIIRDSVKDKLDAWVSARCHLAPGSGTKQICSEQITVLAEGQVQNELHSVIDSLILGDLPVYLWWTLDDLAGDKIAQYLSTCRRLIVDSARAPFSLKFLRELWTIVDSTDGCIAVSDLNWRRLQGIMAAIAEEFERSPLSIESLKEIETVKIYSCAHELQEDYLSAQALLFTGWLASRLKWEEGTLYCPCSSSKENGTRANFIYNKNDIQVQFHSAQVEKVPSGSVYEIEIILKSGILIRISRDPLGQSHTLILTLSKEDKVLKEVIADDSDMDRVTLLGYELEELNPDKIFAQSLECAYSLIESASV